MQDSQKSYSFQKTYTLLPQSPLIHFQWKQAGAALRATEVKPKLDRYIIKRYGKQIPDEWKINQSSEALKYKLRIVAEDTKPVKLGRKSDYEIYFANMNENKESNRENEKRGFFAENKMTVICFDSGLRNYIDDIIGDFFVVSNFGTMQDKGFGCFTVEGRKHPPLKIAELLKEEYGAKACYHFKGRFQKEIFGNIKTVHNILKSGNAFSPKINSLLFEYFEKNYHIKSEKEWLHKRASEGESAYVRALMGISDHMGPVDNPTSISDAKKDKDKGKEKEKEKDKDKDKENAIDRVSSPIWFIVYGDYVYFVGRRIPDNLYGAEFKFDSKSHELNSGKLSVPGLDVVGENFIDVYLSYAAERFEEMYKSRKLRFLVSEVKQNGK